MSQRDEVVNLFVLDIVADDYEDVRLIATQAEELGRRCGMQVSTAEILNALRQLVKAGFVKAYRLSPVKPPEEVPSLPPSMRWDDLHFWITDSGRQIQLPDQASWPFGPDGAVRDDWRLPTG